MTRVPTIGVGALRSGDPSALRATAAAIGRAARDVGFFSIVDHGVPAELVATTFAEAAAFFERPGDVKEQVGIEHSPRYRGYSRLAYEQFDPAHPPDAKESFDVGFDGNQWPEDPRFRETLEAYRAALLALAVDMHRLVAVDLGLDDAYFTPMFAKPMAVLRLLRYPPHPGAFDGTLHGAAPHTDYGTLTLLAQDDAGGLEVRTRDGVWIDVPPVEGAFVCNIGDCLMRWSNDVYVSNLHRVVNRSGRARYSIAFFGDPGAEALVTCVPSCASEEHPPQYEPVSFGAYFQQRISAAYPLHAVTGD